MPPTYCAWCPDPDSPSAEFHPNGSATHTYPGDFPNPGPPPAPVGLTVRIPEDDEEDEDDTPLVPEFGDPGA